MSLYDIISCKTLQFYSLLQTWLIWFFGSFLFGFFSQKCRYCTLKEKTFNIIRFIQHISFLPAVSWNWLSQESIKKKMCCIRTSKFGKSASFLQHRALSLNNANRKVSWQLCTIFWNNLFSHPLHTHTGHSNPPLTCDTLLFVFPSISSGLSRAYYSFNRQGSVGFVWNGSNSRLVKIFIL